MRKILLAIAVVIAIRLPGVTSAQTAIDTEIAPTGKLRMGLNASTTTLVTRTADGNFSGISVDLGKFIAEKLGMAYEPVVYASPATWTASFGKDEWDIGVTGRNATVGKLLDFGPDVILIESVFVAAPGREFTDAREVDRTGIKIAVSGNASADVFLSRTLKSAQIVRVAGDTASVIDVLRSRGKADVYATLAENASVIAERLPGAKIIPGVFNTVGFAVAMPKGRSSIAQARLAQIVNEAKAAGLVQKAVEKSGLKGVRVAPD